MLTWDECKLLTSGTHKEFDQVMEGKGDISDSDISQLREGDLILRNMNMDYSPFYHAGIYCGNEEVIALTAPLGTKWYGKITTLFLPRQSAPVIKESVSNFLNGKLYKVLRLKSGIPEEFSNSVKSAMKCNEDYDLCRNNSLHFALRLLELQAKPLPERNTSSDSKITKAPGSQIQSTMLTWDECKLLTSGTHKEFDQVMEGKGDISDSDISQLREGDLILRNMNMDYSPFYHAGIYCGNEEVIALTAPLGTKWYGKITTLFLPRQSAPVIKESVSNFLNGKLYKVLRLKSGIPEEFSNSVKSAMKCNEDYDLCRNNSLHFALRLLELQAKPLPERNTSSDSKITKAPGSQIQSTMLTWDECKLLTSGTHKEFDQVMEGKGDISDSDISQLREGDLILRNMNMDYSPFSHAGIYCGNEEVIALTDDLERPPMKNDEEGQSLLDDI